MYCLSASWFLCIVHSKTVQITIQSYVCVLMYCVQLRELQVMNILKLYNTFSSFILATLHFWKWHDFLSWPMLICQGMQEFLSVVLAYSTQQKLCWKGTLSLHADIELVKTLSSHRCNSTSPLIQPNEFATMTLFLSLCVHKRNRKAGTALPLDTYAPLSLST